MQVFIAKKFAKELALIPSAYRSNIEHFVFDILPTYDSIHKIGNIEKLKGYEGYYKIRFGDYRVGIVVVKDVVSIERVMHRKEIYRYFP